MNGQDRIILTIILLQFFFRDIIHPMESRPLISIIMAVKDTGPYLAECLDSILLQTYENWELVAVNDHSSDDSWERLTDYAQRDKRIRIFQCTGQRLNSALRKVI